VGKLTGITIDCEDPQRMASFWSLALDGYMADASHTMLTSESGPPINFQKVPEPKSVKGRVHLDIVSKDAKGDLFRLQRMGAKMVETKEEDGKQWTVLLDIEGNEFCLIDGAA